MDPGGETGQFEYAPHSIPPSSDNLPPPTSSRCYPATSLQDSPPRLPSVLIFPKGLERAPPTGASTCALSATPSCAGAPVDMQTLGSVQHDGLTKEEYHKKKKHQKQRAQRRVDREKAQAAMGDTLKASARRYRAARSVIKAPDFKAIPTNVHIAKTGVIGRASRTLPWHRRSVSLKSALQLGFQYVKWSGE